MSLSLLRYYDRGALAKGKLMMQEAKVDASKKKEKTASTTSRKETQSCTSTSENEKWS